MERMNPRVVMQRGMNNRHAHTDKQYRQKRQQAQGPYGVQLPWHVISRFLLHSIKPYCSLSTSTVTLLLCTIPSFPVKS